MAGMNKTGPLSQGTMSGRATGFCTAPAMAGGNPWRRPYDSPLRRGGRGHRNEYYATGLTGWQRSNAARITKLKEHT